MNAQEQAEALANRFGESCIGLNLADDERAAVDAMERARDQLVRIVAAAIEFSAAVEAWWAADFRDDEGGKAAAWGVAERAEGELVAAVRAALGEDDGPGWMSTQAERDATEGTIIRREADDE